MPKVLVVDDEEMVRDVLSQMIAQTGDYVVDTAKDGLDALNYFKENDYDIVFTDIMMPRLSGIELVQELKKTHPSVPVVMVTALNNLETGISAMREGASDYITKPFDVEQIKNVLIRVLNERNLMKAVSGNGDGKETPLKVVNSELYRKLSEINSLFSIGIELEKISDNTEILKKLPEMCSKLFKVDRVVFLLYEDGVLQHYSSVGFPYTGKIEIAGTVFEECLSQGDHLLIDVGQKSPLDNIPLNAQMLLIPLLIKDEALGVLCISNRTDGFNFKEDEIQLALTFIHKVSLRLENNTLYEITYNNLINTLKTLILTIEARDRYTKNHSERVTAIALEIARELDCTEQERDAIRFGGYLHDIGKIGVRDTVLLKPGKLTKEEFEEIKQHPVIGDNIIKPLGSFPLERLLIRHHHERFDGRGYPDGLEGKNIPLIARILAVADTYDSMTSTRPYRKGLSHKIAVDEIKRCSGTQFDPDVANAFFRTPTGKGGNGR
ncbi:MAG: response regulator [Nitrospirae bacterium]|nr:MAG: response regulator [Nitrospirota bacterium]